MLSLVLGWGLEGTGESWWSGGSWELALQSLMAYPNQLPWSIQVSRTWCIICRLSQPWTERLHFHLSLSCIGEGNGNTLQCSCLENPRNGGAWWAAVYGVAQSRTRLKRLSNCSSSPTLESRKGPQGIFPVWKVMGSKEMDSMSIRMRRF